MLALEILVGGISWLIGKKYDPATTLSMVKLKCHESTKWRILTIG